MPEPMLQSNLFTTMVLPATAVILIIIVYLLYSRGKKPSTKDEDNQALLKASELRLLEKVEARYPGQVEVEQVIITEAPVEARIFDNQRHEVYNDTIPGDVVAIIKNLHGHLGRKWLRDGKWVFAFKKTLDGFYNPVYPPFSMEYPPSKLHRALTQLEVAIGYDVQMPQNFFEKYWKVLAWSAVVIFIMFLAVKG